MYGFMSNLVETAIFSRQVEDNGMWRIEYRPVFNSSTTYDWLMLNPPCYSNAAMCLPHWS